MIMHTIQKGDISVAMLTAKFLQLGFVVMKPMSELQRYDLVIDRSLSGEFERIQCKTGRLRDGAVRFNSSSSLAHHKNGGGRKSYVGEIELFGVYCPDNGECYLVPVEDVGLVQGSIRTSPAKNGQQKNVRLAEDYKI